MLRPPSPSPGALAVALTCLLGPTLACESARELPITVVLPADTSDYERADNASLVLRPSGDAFSFVVDGIDFSLELEGDPTTDPQQLELYLAEGDDLIAWGSTVSFATAGPDVGMALFLGRPGLLSSWPERLDAPDPNLLAAAIPGRGMLLVQTDGDTFLLNQYTLGLEVGRRLPDTVSFAGTDGGLFGAADGSAIRLAYEAVTPLAWRYDPSTDAWSELDVDGAEDIGMRPGAAVLVDPDQTRVYLLGGGGASDGVAIDLVPDGQDTLAAAPVADFELDGPRDGATALWIPRGEDPTAEVLIVGGQSEGPAAVLASAGEGLGPSVTWTGLACALRDPAAGVVLCLGGSRDGAPTADALRVEVAEADASVQIRESFLPVAIADPMVFSDDYALYAQGEARWFRIERSDESLSEPESAPSRGSGGHFVALPNGVTFQVGGLDPEGIALDRWQVFTPAVEP